MLPIDIALLRAAFPDWHIVARDRGLASYAAANPATLRAARIASKHSVVGRNSSPSTTADLAVQLAALEYPLGITPTG